MRDCAISTVDGEQIKDLKVVKQFLEEVNK